MSRFAAYFGGGGNFRRVTVYVAAAGERNGLRIQRLAVGFPASFVLGFGASACVCGRSGSLL
jgi:hypothetical protein